MTLDPVATDWVNVHSLPDCGAAAKIYLAWNRDSIEPGYWRQE